jgi:hypothetical protein
VVDDAPEVLAAFPITLHTLRSAGLDRTVHSRGIAVLSAADYASVAAQASKRVRFYRPLTPQLHAVT